MWIMFLQYLSSRPKDEVQFAHFSGKKFTLHCVIVEQLNIVLTFISVTIQRTIDYVIRNIKKYDIRNEVWMKKLHYNLSIQE